MTKETSNDWQECGAAWFFILDKELGKKRPDKNEIEEALQNLYRLGYCVRLRKEVCNDRN